MRIMGLLKIQRNMNSAKGHKFDSENTPYLLHRKGIKMRPLLPIKGTKGLKMLSLSDPHLRKGLRRTMMPNPPLWEVEMRSTKTRKANLHDSRKVDGSNETSDMPL